MPARMDFVTLIPWTDENGYHAKGETVSLPYESETDKMDANRLVDYGVLAKAAPPPRRGKRSHS